MEESNDTEVSNVSARDQLKVFAADLKAFVKSAKLTQQSLSEALKVPSSTVNEWLNGKTLLKLDVLQEIIRLCKGDVRRWTNRWSKVKQTVDSEKTDAAINSPRDLAKLISQALGVQDGLPCGTLVEISIKIQMP